MKHAVADPGFPVGGRAPVGGGRGPPTQVRFGENVCKNERIGFHRERVPITPPRSANGTGGRTGARYFVMHTVCAVTPVGSKRSSLLVLI